MRLNLGCGNRKIEGFHNVDSAVACAPDQVVDLEVFPWPWEDNSVEEIMLNHVLEHLGQETSVYLRVIKEIYRVCKHDSMVHIRVPHPRHDNYLTDPTHVRPITLKGLSMFSAAKCRLWQEAGAANTPLALYMNVDFEIVYYENRLDPKWQSLHDDGLPEEELQMAMRTNYNVIEEVRATLLVQKKAA